MSATPTPADHIASLQQQLGEARKRIAELEQHCRLCDSENGWAKECDRLKVELTRFRCQQQSAGGEWAEGRLLLLTKILAQREGDWKTMRTSTKTGLREYAESILRALDANYPPHAPAIDEQKVREAVETQLDLTSLDGEYDNLTDRIMSALRPLLGRNEEGKP